MNVQDIARSLSVLERKIVPFLQKEITVAALVQRSGMQEVEVMRALQWLGNKGVVEKEGMMNPTTTQTVMLTEKGKRYAQEQKLPERKIVDVLGVKKDLSRDEVKAQTGLTDEELNASIGILKRDGKIAFKEGKMSLFPLGNKKSEVESVFEELCQRGVSGQHTKGLMELVKRGLVEIKVVKMRVVRLTAVGEALMKMKLESNVIDELTPEVLQQQAWKQKTFRTFDITSPVPSLQRGKRHFVDQAINYIKRIWLDLGFKEMQGNVVQTAFWDLDALFVPQDHPAREMQDTFFIGKDRKIDLGKLPKELAAKIKAVHENGGKTGSAGWGGSWREDIARQVLLRTHTTVLSAQTIAQLKKEDLPAKFFAVGKVYRNEALDWKHLFEFYQVEGIVIDPDANMRHLIGYLKEFYAKMGFDKIRIRPSHFPYTEPSCEVEVWHPVKKQWVELGGAGIFRPEVVQPLLGFDCPVLAWGQGMERIIVDYYKIGDLRELYKNDMKQLRQAREWVR